MTLEPSTALYVLLLIAALGLLVMLVYRRWQSRQVLLARVADLTVLADIGRAISEAALDLERLAEVIYQQTGHIVDTSMFQLGLFQDDRYRLLIWVVDGVRQPTREFQLTPDSLGIVGWMRDSHRSLLVRDFEAERATLPAHPRYISDNPPRSAVFVPLLMGDTALGAIAIQSRQANAFTEEHLRLLAIVANHAAAALEKARVYEQAQQRADHLAVLAEVTKQINVLQPLPALYKQIVDLVARRLIGNEVSFFAKSGEALRLQATTAVELQNKSLTLAANDHDSLVVQANLDRKPIARESLPKWASGGGGDAPEHRAEMAVPVEIEDRVVGVLEVRSRTRAQFDSGEKSLFESLAGQIAFAILEAELFAAEQRRAEQLTAIAQVSRTIVSTLDLDEMFDEVLDRVEDSFGYKRAHIFLSQDGRMVFRAGIGKGAARWLARGLAYELDAPGLIPLAGRTHQVVLASDTSAHPDFIPNPGLDDTRSQLAVPMQMGENLLGVFDVQSERPGQFTQDDVQVLQTLADTLAVAVRNARLFEIERRRRHLAETLREVSAGLTSTLNLTDVLDLILSGLARVVNYDAASILLVNEANEVVLQAARGSRALTNMIGEVLDVRLFGKDEALAPVVNFGDLDSTGAYHDLVALPDPHASLGAVLTLRREQIGYLVVDRSGITYFPTGEVELISAFASQAAIAIANARLYAAQLEQAWVSGALLKVAEATTQATELDEVLQTVARLTPMLVGVDRCAVLLLEEETFVVKAYHALQTPDGPLEETLRVSASDWPKLNELLETHQPVVIDLEEEPDSLWDGLRSLFGEVVVLLPLLAKGEVEGVLIVGQTLGEEPLSAHRVELLGGIANQTAMAIESARLGEAQREEAWISAALLQVAETVAQQRTLDEGLESVARLTPMLVGLERVVIYRWEGGAGLFHASQVTGFKKENAALIRRTPWSAEDFEIDPKTNTTLPAFQLELNETQTKVFECGKVMVWPLWSRGDLLGALMVEFVPLEVLGRRLTILDGIAHQLSLAMDSARLEREVALQHKLERDVEMARAIQASFLPESCPVVQGWEVSAFWQAARQVGGDFYDFIRLRPTDEGHERWGIVIADVADKGMAAALFMALSRTLMRTVAINRIAPAITMSRVNELVNADAKTDLFVTIFYAVWEPVAGRFTYVNAGHNPPVLAEPNKTPMVLEGRGVPVGVFDEANYQEHVVYVPPGGTLLFYTDGLTEAVNMVNEEFGVERVEQVVETQLAGTATEIIDAVASAVLAHVGVAETFDDMTMVVMKRMLDS
jgi:phosphoserine phosphatase RsbU/P